MKNISRANANKSANANANANVKSKAKKRMAVPAMIALDTVLTAAAIGTFMLFDYVMPQTSSTTGTVVAQAADTSSNTFALPSDSTSSADSDSSTSTDSSEASTDTSSAETDDTASSTATTTSSSATTTSSSSSNTRSFNRGGRSDGGGMGGTDNTNTGSYSSDSTEVQTVENEKVTSTKVATYKNSSAQITIYKKTYGSGNDTVTYYVTDVYVTNASVIKTALAGGTYGKNVKDSIANMASENSAIWAINGDFYGNSESGVVIRNGVKYRDNSNGADVCVLFTDGTMKTYSSDEFDADAVIKAGAWQAWSFGPALLDGSGNVLSSFNTTSYISSTNPRSAIGYVAAGHYKFVTVDGRNVGYSKGVTMSGLAAIMKTEGCKSAYNLDGGKSAMTYYNGSIINQADGGGREISDIIYIGK